MTQGMKKTEPIAPHMLEAYEEFLNGAIPLALKSKAMGTVSITNTVKDIGGNKVLVELSVKKIVKGIQHD